MSYFSKDKLYGTGLLIALFFNKTFWIGKLFGLEKVNTFVSLVINLTDLAVLIVIVSIIISSKKFETYIVTIFVLLHSLIANLFFSYHWSSIAISIMTLARIYLWIHLLIQIKDRKLRNLLVLALLPIAIFDHLLISNSLAVYIFYLSLKSLKNRYLKYGINLWLVSNLSISLIQMISSKSIGFGLFGESVLALDMKNVSSWNFANIEILRAYGLTPHPNILGSVALIYLVIQIHYSLKYKLKIKEYFDLNKLINLFPSLILIVLSFSRAAIIGLSIFLLTKIRLFKDIFINAQNRLYKYLLVLIATFVIFTGLPKSSDFYRIQDMTRFVEVYTDVANFNDVLFGVGVGNYPFFLQKEFGYLDTWQWQPVHNLFLNLLIEIGIIPLLIMGVYAILKFKRDYNNRSELGNI